MLFNTLDFAIFLPIVFFLYWFIANKSIKLQNLLIVLSSYLFYGWWDWRFLSLIIFSTSVDYIVGFWLSKVEKIKVRQVLLWTSIFINIGFLGFFKYFNFFLESFQTAFSFFGIGISTNSLNIILPVGISFYTFQTLSYTIDVFKRKLQPTKDFIAFAAFVSFFPQLVAGPIERATELLPQFYIARSFDSLKAVDGLRQILWGLFKKIVIADNCAVYVNDIFLNYDSYPGSSLLLGGIFFAFQIYGDFSGYSDIAIGTSRLFGFNLSQNFAFPYFSRDIAEFWRRWHISLSSWFRDYLYIPLGGSQGSKFNQIRNIFIIFIVSGFWHGANWTYIIWGFLNALYFLPLMLLNRNRKHLGSISLKKNVPNLTTILKISITFFATVLAWIFFRSESVYQAFDYLKKIFSSSLFKMPENLSILMLTHIIIIIAFIIVEWMQREQLHGLELTGSKLSRIYRWSIYYLIILSIIWYGGNQQEFIYFQF